MSGDVVVGVMATVGLIVGIGWPVWLVTEGTGKRIRGRD